MFKKRVTQFTIKQRAGESPDILVTRTQYIPIPLKHSKTKGKNKPIDYGITEEQFDTILKKAAQPTKKLKTDLEKLDKGS